MNVSRYAQKLDFTTYKVSCETAKSWINLESSGKSRSYGVLSGVSQPFTHNWFLWSGFPRFLRNATYDFIHQALKLKARGIKPIFYQFRHGHQQNLLLLVRYKRHYHFTWQSIYKRRCMYCTNTDPDHSTCKCIPTDVTEYDWTALRS